jgi:guanylate kinase
VQEERLIILSAPSGTGKSTITKSLLQRNSNLQFSISTTTRKPRNGEQHGVQYYFTDDYEFQRMIRDKEFLEWAQVFTNHYGTTRKEVERIIAAEHYCLLDIDVQGALNIQQIYPNCKRIFILPPSVKELERRLRERGDTMESDIQIRLETMRQELSYIQNYQYFVVNDDLKTAVQTIEVYIFA